MEKTPRLRLFWPALAWCLGVLGMIGIWLGVSVWRDSPCLWMSIFSVIDLALILRFTGVDAGWPRFFGILIGSTIIVIASQWLIAANAFGLVMGLWPLEAAQQIGSVLAWEFTRLRMHQIDVIYLPITIIFAWHLELRPTK